jgi:hypothetical protein
MAILRFASSKKPPSLVSKDSSLGALTVAEVGDWAVVVAAFNGFGIAPRRRFGWLLFSFATHPADM